MFAVHFVTLLNLPFSVTMKASFTYKDTAYTDGLNDSFSEEFRVLKERMMEDDKVGQVTVFIDTGCVW